MDSHIILTISILLISSSIPPTTTSDITRAIEEMQKANYFTFVTLINMSPRRLPNNNNNITFLMPNDKTLSSNPNFLQRYDSISDFLHHHSIPSALLFETMQHIPSGSFIPSSFPDFMFKILNGGGRRNFSLNNVKIISPNICTLGFSIRCHGIDGVLDLDIAHSSPTCGLVDHGVVATPPLPAPAPAPAPAHDSDSAACISFDLLKMLPLFLMIPLLGNCL